MALTDARTEAAETRGRELTECASGARSPFDRDSGWIELTLASGGANFLTSQASRAISREAKIENFTVTHER